MIAMLSWIVTGLVSLAASLFFVADAPARKASALAEAITKADEQFCQAVADRNVDRFVAFIDENATFNSGGDVVERGRTAVQQAWAPYFKPGGPTLMWKPDKAEVLPQGEVGYTVGHWERRVTDATGQTSVTHGNYLTVWRKQADGSWKVVFDAGSTTTD